MKTNLFLFFTSVGLLIFSIFLRWYSYPLTWPDKWTYSGERASQNWAIYEAALNDISMMLFFLGTCLITLSCYLHFNRKNV